MLLEKLVHAWELSHLANLQCEPRKLGGEELKQSLVLFLVKHLRKHFFSLGFLHFCVPIFCLSILRLWSLALSEDLLNDLDNTTKRLGVG